MWVVAHWHVRRLFWLKNIVWTTLVKTNSVEKWNEFNRISVIRLPVDGAQVAEKFSFTHLSFAIWKFIFGLCDKIKSKYCSLLNWEIYSFWQKMLIFQFTFHHLLHENRVRFTSPKLKFRWCEGQRTNTRKMSIFVDGVDCVECKWRPLGHIPAASREINCCYSY